MKFTGHIVEVDHEKKEFHVSLEDENGVRSVATIIFGTVPEDQQDRICLGNYLEYELDERFENLNLLELKVWTKEDEEKAMKEVKRTFKFLEEVEKEDGSQDTK